MQELTRAAESWYNRFPSIQRFDRRMGGSIALLFF
jgi:hypothetical protein